MHLLPSSTIYLDSEESQECILFPKSTSSSFHIPFIVTLREERERNEEIHIPFILFSVKDQTSISLAKVSINASSIDVAILKATSHDDVPIDERYVDEVLEIISSNKIYAAACAKAIAKRISKTKNWVVALKCLVLVLRIFQDGDPNFPREVLNAMKQGAKILNLSNFRDDSASTPWDYTTYVRTFALYLDDRLDCFLAGKLQKNFAFRDNSKNNSVRSNEPVRNMKPSILLDRLSCWQKLLGRAIATRPTGPAKENSLVRISLYAIVKESFDLYRDISDGLALLLDSFFHLKYKTGICCFQTCVQASKQFEELCEFYDACKNIGVGRTSEYPSVQKISDKLIETLQEFLKDQASFPSGSRSPGSMLPLPALESPNDEQSETSERFESFSERDFEFGSRGTSFDDFASVANSGTTSSRSPSMCTLDLEGIFYGKDKQVQLEVSTAVFDHGSSSSIPDFFADWPQNHQQENITSSTPQLEMIEDSSVNLFEDRPQLERQEHKVDHEDSRLSSQNTSLDCWELVLFEAAKQSQVVQSSDNFLDTFCSQNSMTQYHNNPFLQDTLFIPVSPMAASEVDANSSSFSSISTTDIFSAESTFQTITPFPAQATPTFQTAPSFRAEATQDFFVQTFEATPTFSTGGAPTFQTIPSFGAVQGDSDPFAASCAQQKPSVNHEIALHEQQLWLENQTRIIAKHLSGVP